ncbi:MAG TPA: LTA synthase family protein [Symbiobacteriaceae bacterium]|nr:LTA synthase family protein [Symbiobacteriaceae bacterium]
MQATAERSTPVSMSPLPLQGWYAILTWFVLTGLAVYTMRAGLGLIGVWPGPYMELFSLGTGLAVTAWFRGARPRRQITAMLIFQVTVSLLVWMNVLYFRRFGDLVSIASARFVLQLGDVGGNVTELFRASDARLWLGTLGTAALYVLPRTWQERLFQPWRLPWRALVSVATVGLLVLTVTKDPILKAKYYGHTNIMARLGALGYHSADIASYTERLTSRLMPAGPSVAKVQSWFDQRPPVTSPLTGQYKGKNVIVIQLESFQSFPLGMKIGGAEVTPNLNKLMQESVTLPNFWSQTGQGVTADADLLANCSLYPSRTGAIYYDFAGNDYRCMPQLMKEAGYRTEAFQGIRADFWNLSTVYPNIGFDKFNSLSEYSYTEEDKILLGLSDEAFFQKTVDKLKALPQPFYAFTVSLTSHGPFNVVHAPVSLDVNMWQGSHAGNYLQAVHYTDQAVGHFIDKLKAEGILDTSIIMIYGDHMGLYRQDPGVPELVGNFDQHDEATWLPWERRVPMIIRLPHGEHAGVQHQIASEVDIGPTLLDLLGVQPKNAFLMGSSMLDPNRQKVVSLPTGSAADSEHLYVIDAPPERSCFSVKTGHPVGTSECDQLRETADKQLDVSRTIVDHDLIGDLIKP